MSLETVSFNPHHLKNIDLGERHEIVSKHNIVPCHSSDEDRQSMAWDCTPRLTVDRLSAINSFERYEGAIWNLRTVRIKFYVKYNDGSEGYVYGGPSISGKTSSEVRLLDLRCKVVAAKSLLGDEEWSRLRQKYGAERDRTLELSRRMNLDPGK